MTFVTPPTFTVGQVLTAAQQNILSGDLTYLNSRQAPVTGQITGTTGAITAGTGFSCTRTGTGTYQITYSPTLSAAPVVAIQPVQVAVKSVGSIINSNTSGQTQLKIFDTTVANLGSLLDQDFLFIATPLV
jgi:hypothetical protein